MITWKVLYQSSYLPSLGLPSDFTVFHPACTWLSSVTQRHLKGLFSFQHQPVVIPFLALTVVTGSTLTLSCFGTYTMVTSSLLSPAWMPRELKVGSSYLVCGPVQMENVGSPCPFFGFCGTSQLGVLSCLVHVEERFCLGPL